MLAIGPIRRSAVICSRKSSRVKLSPPASLAVIRSFCSSSNAASACSMRVSTSPMPRMRPAIRSGWKTSKSSSFSPVEANRIGCPVTSRTDSAAPPRASPSNLDSTTPVMPTPSRNASAVATASWPTIASTTNRISSGLTASRMSAAWAIISASMPSRPAVSTMTMSRIWRRACSIESRATATGSPTPLPGSGAYTSTPARLPSTWSWLTALGRCRSQATSSGWWPRPLRWRASLPASVVLPEPCRPASMITVGGVLGELEPPGLAAEDRRPAPRGRS